MSEAPQEAAVDTEAAGLAATSIEGSAPPQVVQEVTLSPEEADQMVEQAIAQTSGDDIPVVPEFQENQTPAAAPPETPETPAPEETVTPEPEPTPAPEIIPVVPWDKTRQVKDQTIANQGKQIEQLQTQMKQMEQGGAVRSSEEIIAELATLEASQLDELATEEDRNQRSNERGRLQLELARAGNIKEQGADDATALDETLRLVCADEAIGEEYRNGIVDGLNRRWDERGYGPGNMPNAQHVFDIAHGIGLELVREAKAATPAPTPTPAPATPPLDPGTGGAAPEAPPATGVKQAMSNAEAILDMRKEGLIP